MQFCSYVQCTSLDLYLGRSENDHDFAWFQKRLFSTSPFFQKICPNELAAFFNESLTKIVYKHSRESNQTFSLFSLKTSIIQINIIQI